MAANIALTLSETARIHGERTAVVEAASGRAITFRDLELRADRFGRRLRAEGVGVGDRVILMVRPSIDFIALAFSLFKIGATAVLIDPGMGYRNLLGCIRRVRPDFLVSIPLVVFLSLACYPAFITVRKRFCCGFFPGVRSLNDRGEEYTSAPLAPFRPGPDSLAAIIFTTGSTGPPKGVRFEHSIFAAQLEKIRTHYGIGPEDIDQPGFPLFALFSTALGACAVIPDMNPSRPARVDPDKFVRSIQRYQVTYSFGSPAIWRVVSRHCLDNGIRCPSLRKVLMAGAPVGGGLVADVFKMIGDNGEIHTPYGATESLPVASIEGREIVTETWAETDRGKGACVGRPLPGITVNIIEATETNPPTLAECRVLGPGEIGEIIVRGDVVTRAYDGLEAQTRASKIADGVTFWHRMGDVGYVDNRGRLWFCGRKAHRVVSSTGIMYTICCEALINLHPDVFRSALVGIGGDGGQQIPVLILELHKEISKPPGTIVAEVRKMCTDHPLTAPIEEVLIHPGFPVDIRHNAKIFREKLALWAERRLVGG